jgi:hypothetical protein
MIQVTHQGTIDPETGEALQTVYTLDDGADEATRAAAAAQCQRVLWTRIRTANERKWLKAELVRRTRLALILAARARKEKVDEQGLLSEEKAIRTGMLKLEAEIRSDAQMAAEEPDTCMARLRAEVAQDATTAVG